MTLRPQRGLGRRHAPDHRDASFPAAPILPSSSDRSYRYWATASTKRLDQGRTDSCVGHGWSHFLTTSPLTPAYSTLDIRAKAAGYPLLTKGINPFAARVYDRAQEIDEFADTPPAGGTSVRAGAKALQAVGMISDYLWLHDTTQITLALLELGPVVVGTDWYEGMFNPTAPAPGSGSMIAPTGNVAGGHCYLLTGVNGETERFRVLNSWGLGWGNAGYAYIKISDFAQLLAAGGEACLTSDLV